jgi:hypothetical protein
MAKPVKRKTKPKTTRTTKAASKKSVLTTDTIEPKEGQPKMSNFKLSSIIKLSRDSAELIWEHRRTFLGICVTYGLLNLILVQGLASGSNVGNLKSELHKGLSGHFGSLVASAGVYAELLSSSGNGSSDTAGAYQLFLFILVSLAIIWTLRQVIKGQNIRIRDAFYLGMTPLVPFVLVVLVFCLQLIPFVIGSSLYGLAVGSGVAGDILEKVIFMIVFIVLALWSFYMISSTIFAVYIVTLPEMTPLKALRSAKDLVKKRRLLLIRKILGLPVVLVVVSAVIMIPIILIATTLAQWVFFILTTLILLSAHAYLYTLYRELLNE